MAIIDVYLCKLVKSHPVMVMAVVCITTTFSVTHYFHTERISLSSEKNKLEIQEISNKHNQEVRELKEKFAYIKRDLGGIEYIDLKNLLVLGKNNPIPKKSKLLNSEIYSSKDIKGLTYTYDQKRNNTHEKHITSIDKFYDSLKYISHTHRWQSDVIYNFSKSGAADSQPIYAKIELRKVKKIKLKIRMAQFLKSPYIKPILQLAFPSKLKILVPSEDEIVVNTDDADVIGSLYIYAQFMLMIASSLFEQLDWELSKLERSKSGLYSQYRTIINGVTVNGNANNTLYITSEIILIDAGDYIYYVSIDSPSVEPFDRSGFKEAVGQWLAVTRFF